MALPLYMNVLTEIDRGVGIVTLIQPNRHNAFDDVTIAELTHAVATLEADPAVRVVVIGSIGKSFCAGADLKWMQRAAGYDAEQNLRDARALAEMLQRVAHCTKPVIARVQGPAYGGGVGLIAACDIAIATLDAQFALSEVRLGIIPATISPHVIAAIGERHARRYMLTAERFSADEAYRLGLVHEIVTDEAALDDAIGDIIDALLANGPDAMTECKDLIRAVAGRPLDALLAEETAQRIARVRSTDEAKEGMAAFLERRQPNWNT
jgi:methylglutaconyl-CoA hydratase